MRLRRETGDFKIVGVIDSITNRPIFNTLPTGLLMEDLVGAIIEIHDVGYYTVNSVEIIPPGGPITTERYGLYAASSSSNGLSLWYDPLTGEVTTSSGGPA